MGEKSIPDVGIILLIGSSIGSVALYKNCTIALKGSGLTQLSKARTKISQYIIDKTTFKISAIAIKRFPIINIDHLPSITQRIVKIPNNKHQITNKHQISMTKWPNLLSLQLLM